MANFLQDSFFEFCECLLFVHQLWTLVLWSSQASQIAVVAPCAVCGMRSAEYYLALLPLLSVYSRSTSHRHSAATSARSLAPGHRRPHTQHRSRVIANAFAALARTKSGGIQRGVRLHIAGISSCTNRVSPFAFLSCGVVCAPRCCGLSECESASLCFESLIFFWRPRLSEWRRRPTLGVGAASAAP